MGLLDVLLIQRVQCFDGVVVLRQGLSADDPMAAFRPLGLASERLATSVGSILKILAGTSHHVWQSLSNFNISTSSAMGKNLKGRVAFVQPNAKVPIMGRFIIADHQKIIDRLSQQSHY